MLSPTPDRIIPRGCIDQGQQGRFLLFADEVVMKREAILLERSRKLERTQRYLMRLWWRCRIHRTFTEQPLALACVGRSPLAACDMQPRTFNALCGKSR